MKHLVWCDSRILDAHLPCNCTGPISHEQMDTELRRAERERCAKVADVFAADAHFEYSNDVAREAAADVARRVARDLRLMEDE